MLFIFVLNSSMGTLKFEPLDLFFVYRFFFLVFMISGARMFQTRVHVEACLF